MQLQKLLINEAVKSFAFADIHLVSGLKKIAATLLFQICNGQVGIADLNDNIVWILCGGIYGENRCGAK